VASPIVKTVAADGSRHEIAVAGRLYAAAAPELRRALEPAAERARTILVDATQLEAVDAVALQAFVEALKRLRPRGGTMVFFGLTPPNRRLFEITGLDRVVTIVASRDEALGASA
jgi:anti-anti-sigma factor